MVVKRDFRTLAPATQAELRRVAVAMVRAGKTRVEAAKIVGGLSRDWGSGCGSHWRERVIGGLEALPEAGAERAVVEGAADLEQQIGPALGPAHLLRLGHAAVHQEVGRALGQRRADPLPGPVPFGVIDQMGALDLIGETLTWLEGMAEAALTAAAKATALLRGLETYVSGQADLIIDYATAQRRDEPISTATTEGTVQWLLHRRMGTNQQMRWTPRGAHCMLKVRTAVANDTLAEDHAAAERWARRPFRPPA